MYCPTHFLAKIIDNTLRYCFKNPASHIDNSFVLNEKLADKFIPHGYILVSLDIISLFTNIPLELVLRSLDKRFHKIQSSSKIPFVNIIDIVKFLFDNTYFLFDNTIYKQIFGTPMGFPISPTFADIVLED